MGEGCFLMVCLTNSDEDQEENQTVLSYLVAATH